MDNDAAVAEEGTNSGDQSGVVVGVAVELVSNKILEARMNHLPLRVARSAELAVLAREITDLAALRLVGVTGGILAALVGVKVSKRLGAVAILGNRLVVDVVRVWAIVERETRDGDLELDTSAAADRGGSHRATNGGVLAVGESGDVDSAGRVVGNDSGVGSGSGGGRAGDSEEEGGATHLDGVVDWGSLRRSRKNATGEWDAAKEKSWQRTGLKRSQ